MIQITGIIIICIFVIALIILASFFYYLSIWIRALISGYPIPMTRLISMKLRRIPPTMIVDVYIRGKLASLDFTLDQLEAHYLVGGGPARVIDAMVKAKNRNIIVPFSIVAKTDLAGFDLNDVDPEEFKKVVGIG